MSTSEQQEPQWGAEEHIMGRQPGSGVHRAEGCALGSRTGESKFPLHTAMSCRGRLCWLGLEPGHVPASKHCSVQQPAFILWFIEICFRNKIKIIAITAISFINSICIKTQKKNNKNQDIPWPVQSHPTAETAAD